MGDDPPRVFVERHMPPAPPEGFQITWSKAGILLTIVIILGGFVADVIRLEINQSVSGDKLEVLTKRLEAAETANAAAHDSIIRLELQIPAIAKFAVNPTGRK